MLTLTRIGAWLAAATLVGGCDGTWWPTTDVAGSSVAVNVADAGTDTDTNDNDAAVVSCNTDSRVNHLVDGGSSKQGALGVVEATLLHADPAPPSLQNNTWVVRLTDSKTGAPLVGATIVASAKMPDHGHLSPIVPKVTAMADGVYTVDPLYFFMPGVWRVSLDVRPAGQEGGVVLDTVLIYFCING